MSLNIGIDGLPLQIVGNQTGVYQYTRQLLDGLQTLDRQNQYQLFFFSCRDSATRQLVDSYQFQDNFHKRLYRAPYRLLRTLGRWAPANSRLLGKLDVYHGPAFRLLPRSYYRRSLATIHDINFLKHPELFPDSRGREEYLYETAHAVRHADLLVTVSEFTKAEVMQAYAVDAQRIRVVYPGINADFHAQHPPALIAQALQRYGIRAPYLLFVGLQEPKKNLVRLLEAFALARGSLSQPYQLVLVGASGPATPDIVKRAAELNLGDDLLLTGHVAKADLPLLYAGAETFIFPSLYEGFGIPVIEAMASGTPVIASNVASLPEVVGNAGLLIDPLNSVDLAEAIHAVLSNAELKQGLIQRGFIQASQFSWAEMARQYFQIYQDL